MPVGRVLKKALGYRSRFPPPRVGHIAYPALTSFLAGDNNLGVDVKRMSSGCVYFGKWDRTSERCALFTQIYGKDFFTESNAQKLRDGTFDFDKYRAKFPEFMQQKH